MLRTAHRLAVPVRQSDHVEGSLDAPLVLVEYGDYQCSYCGAAYGIVQQLRAEFGERLAFVFRNFPLTQIHPDALVAAEAAEAAGAQGRFWQMHDRLYTHQDGLDPPQLLAHAAALGLDVPRFESDLETQAFLGRVEDDLESGIASGVEGTPTFFVNGVRHNGAWDERVLRAALEGELAARSRTS